MAFLFRWWIKALLDGNKFVVAVTGLGAVALALGPFSQALASRDPAAIGIVAFVAVGAVVLVVLAIVDRRLNPPARKPKSKPKSKPKVKAQPQSQPKAQAVGRPQPRPAAPRPERPAPPAPGPSTAPGGAAATLVASGTITVGEPIVIEGPSPGSRFSVVFEDDGATGYLYGLDTARADNPILDALHIYNVEQVADRARPSTVQLIWSRDGLKAALLINKHPHAVFDFEARRGCCRTGYPPPDTRWTRFDHAWDESALDHFRRR